MLVFPALVIEMPLQGLILKLRTNFWEINEAAAPVSINTLTGWFVIVPLQQVTIVLSVSCMVSTKWLKIGIGVCISGSISRVGRLGLLGGWVNLSLCWVTVFLELAAAKMEVAANVRFPIGTVGQPYFLGRVVAIRSLYLAFSVDKMVSGAIRRTGK